MFSNAIYSTQFVGGAADKVCGQVIGNAISSDVSFISTLRALLLPRIKENESVYLNAYDTSFRVSDNYGRITNGSMAFSESYCGIVEIINIISEASPEVIDSLSATIQKDRKDFVLLPKVTEFFRKAFPVLCFINPVNRNVCLITWGLTLKRMHYLQCAIVAFLPWYFTEENAVTDDEMELIKSLTEKTSNSYLSALNKLADKYDFRAKNIKSLLDGFEYSAEIERADALRDDIADIINSIRGYNAAIADCLRKKNEYETNLLSLDMKLAENSGESEIMEYFICNKKLNLRSRRGREIRFDVCDYLTYFDEEMAQTVIDNPHSYVYAECMGGRITKDMMKSLMKAIFIDQILKIKFCAEYVFRIDGNIDGLSNAVFEIDEAMPNPHINNYSCLGNYTRNINNLMLDHNYISAIEQCIASCKSLNFGDHTVMCDFMKTMYSPEDYRFIELPDGKMVGSIEACKWLLENTKEEKNDNE